MNDELQAIEAPPEIKQAVQELRDCDVGRDALQHLLPWLDSRGCSLDGRNQENVLILLEAAWGRWAGTVRDLMREAIE